ncbi:hypothetical protein B0H14DRAFT_2662440 [Mycena olivaceomarginata]|nr:hypothetical protein B0H14DRAFT_2662440 [Mycena olivaceomarginata]
MVHLGGRKVFGSAKQPSPPPVSRSHPTFVHPCWPAINLIGRTMYRALRFTQKRQFVSSLFGFTFLAAVVTVSASSILPCPARPTKGRYADSERAEWARERRGA